MVKLRIKELLKTKGLSQAELARRLGVSTISVNAWAQGNRYPTIAMLDNIAQILSVPITHLFEPPDPTTLTSDEYTPIYEYPKPNQ